ncbi:MAG: ATP phosphoribosyltransferase [Chitinophagaceae bacterium]
MALKIAIQKSGRLFEDSLKMLENCGIDVISSGNAPKPDSENLSLEILFFPEDDIPQYVQDGIADIGIVGENILYEKCKDVEILSKLGFGKCRLSIAIPRNQQYTDVHFLKGKKIATSYPFLCEQFLKKNHIPANIHEISRSVEIAPGIGLADAVCDMVNSGFTLFMNGLKEVETVLESEAVLIRNVSLRNEQLNILEKFLFRINAVKKADANKYIWLNTPDEVLQDVISFVIRD